MNVQLCKNCGKEVLAGKRFCGGCGQALPVESAPTEATPELPAQSATTACTQCGAALTPGKRFCKQCGKAVLQPGAAHNPAVPDMPTVTAVPDDSPDSSVCGQCGAEIPAGKRFCKRCGQPVQASQPAVNGEAVLPVQEIAQNVEDAPVPALSPALQSGEVPSPAPAPFSDPAPAVPRSVPVPRAPSKAWIGIAAAVAVVVVATAGGGWMWYVHKHRTALHPPASPVQTAQNAQAPIQNFAPATPVAATPAKPSATGPKSIAASAPTTQPNPTAASEAPPTPALAPLNSNRPAHMNPTEPTPASIASSAPAFQPSPAQPRSGVLHYQGPPVPYLGTVLFDHLPAGRLRFSFDHSAWQITLKRNPDGTKRVTMISQRPGYQNTCDLGWEVTQ